MSLCKCHTAISPGERISLVIWSVKQYSEKCQDKPEDLPRIYLFYNMLPIILMNSEG